jgi:hypothetical protein
MAIEAFNKFFVSSVAGERFKLMRSPGIMSADDALNLAAWLVAMADHSPNHERFAEVLRAVQET